MIDPGVKTPGQSIIDTCLAIHEDKHTVHSTRMHRKKSNELFPIFNVI